MRRALLTLLLLSCILHDGLASIFPTRKDISSSQLLKNIGRRFAVKHVSSNGLRTLKDDTSECEWDEDKGECIVSSSEIGEVLQKVGTPLAKFLIEFSVCFAKTDQETCDAAAACHWNMYSSFCELSDIGLGRESSPCYKAAPLFYKFVHSSTICEKTKDINTCTMNMDCDWSYRIYACEADFYYVFFGIKNFDDTTQELGERRGHMISDILEASGKTSAPGFKWEDMLDYKIPHLDCFKGTLQLTCDVVDTYLASFLPVLYYCRGKHKTQKGCISDPLCQAAGASVCWPSDSIIHSSYLTALQYLADSLPSPIDREFVSLLFKCDAIVSAENCTEHCVWNSMVESCVSNEQYLASILSKPGEDTDDGLCKLLEAASKSDCEAIYDKSVCDVKDTCRWRTTECGTRDEEFVKVAVEGYPKLSRSFRRSMKRCVSYTSETDCSGDSEQYGYTTVV
eukprot:g1364.t1